MTAAQGTPAHPLALVVNGANAWGPTGLDTFAFSKGYSLGVLPSINLNLGADCNLPMWGTDWSWHTLNHWELL